ncbi:N5-glutamine methyltransferase family protein [Algisphaera agarilytica]|uniref:Release factor glutamine methyltransferase n=1 Tax=Algisphaera agarilytica TaxID=1385975 RepID=A0A7X0H683_9BACT|nr:HemK/PrmC family methyltransferase [Algisphaera agarilytica]MBB6429994.1 release factor glutamine methyltransferase [Algisphaera agarilytica]
MDTWTTRKLLSWTTQHFEDKGVDSPRVAAEMLLGHVLDVPRLKLYMEPDRPASEEERQTFRELVTRAGKHEPVDYLIGKAPFFGLELRVTPAVLIPRPSTETIIEYVLQAVRSPQRVAEALPVFAEEQVQPRDSASAPAGELTYEPEPMPEESQTESEAIATEQEDSAFEPPAPKPAPGFNGRIADVCTGSGAIAVTLATQLPEATFVATDLSEDALAIARQNAEDHGVADRIEFRHGSLYEPLGDERFDFVLSNPPYISDAEWAEVLPNVKDYEPTMALRSGADGLDHLRPLIADASRYLLPQGQILLEMSSTQADAVERFASEAGLSDIAVLKDHEEFPRIVVGRATGAQ